jgi:CheY-like chemotaxis protein
MKGVIGVESTPGRGSTFWFEIEAPFVPTAVTGARFSGLRLLLAARPSLSCESLQCCLRRWDVNVEVCASPEEFVRRRAEPVFDGVIVDPDFCALEELRGDELILANRTLRQLWVSLGHSGDRCICLPLRAKQLANVLGTLDAVAAPRPDGRPDAARLTSKPNEGAGLRVLIVEDNAVNQRVAQRLLLLRGYTVEVAGNGALGVEAARNGGFDVILMDCQMPVLDGFQATRQIRALETSGRRTPIIALTAGVLANDRDKCVAAGMDDLLLKPFHPEQLYETVLRWALHPALK